MGTIVGECDSHLPNPVRVSPLPPYHILRCSKVFLGTLEALALFGRCPSTPTYCGSPQGILFFIYEKTLILNPRSLRTESSIATTIGVEDIPRTAERSCGCTLHEFPVILDHENATAKIESAKTLYPVLYDYSNFITEFFLGITRGNHFLN